MKNFYLVEVIWDVVVNVVEEVSVADEDELESLNNIVGHILSYFTLVPVVRMAAKYWSPPPFPQ